METFLYFVAAFVKNSLETFLVEWKPTMQTFPQNVIATLKPS